MLLRGGERAGWSHKSSWRPHLSWLLPDPPVGRAGGDLPFPSWAAGHLVTAFLDTAREFFHLSQLNFTFLVSGQCFQRGTGFPWLLQVSRDFPSPLDTPTPSEAHLPRPLLHFIHSFIQQAFVEHPLGTGIQVRFTVQAGEQATEAGLFSPGV